MTLKALMSLPGRANSSLLTILMYPGTATGTGLLYMPEKILRILEALMNKMAAKISIKGIQMISLFKEVIQMTDQIRVSWILREIQGCNILVILMIGVLCGILKEDPIVTILVESMELYHLIHKDTVEVTYPQTECKGSQMIVLIDQWTVDILMIDQIKVDYLRDHQVKVDLAYLMIKPQGHLLASHQQHHSQGQGETSTPLVVCLERIDQDLMTQEHLLQVHLEVKVPRTITPCQGNLNTMMLCQGQVVLVTTEKHQQVSLPLEDLEESERTKTLIWSCHLLKHPWMKQGQ